jgi:putative radical SAM enzyme (TIGR03279 family)
MYLCGCDKMVFIKHVLKNSPACKKGIRPGDGLISINGNKIKDVLDYRFFATEKEVDLLLSRDGGEFSVHITKGEYEDLGLEFESYLMDKKKCCRNKCIFCFIDQNPPGMREGIYFKDDDERLSFLQGNYVTLTNMTDEDVERIIKMKISPINISVHTMDRELRRFMTGNRFAGDKLDYLYTLSQGGTKLNLQFVLCRGINDGKALEYSLSEIKKFPTLVSASVVPAGLTKHRNGLYPIPPYDKESAGEVIDLVEKYYNEFKTETGTGKVFCSDEFYLLAGRPLHDGEYYEGYPQYENGVGMLTDMKESFSDALEDTDSSAPGEIHLATGRAAYPLMANLAEEFSRKFTHKKIIVHEIINEFYGSNVTVAGLITGQDYIKQLKGKVAGSLLISRSSLNADCSMFLDDITPKQLEKELNVKLILVENDGWALCRAFAEN